jgi:peptidoglycan/xylan/chitin deacetylase (PgdA/CDA1 family)
MRFVSPLLKHVVYPSLAKAGVFRRSAAEGLSIVTYHGVLPEGYKVIDPTLDGSLVQAAAFREQLRLLRENYNVISPERMLQWCEDQAELPPRPVLVTCDDGLVNVVTDMLPILREAGIPCLFFVIGLSAEDAPRMLWYEELYLMLAASGEGSFSVRLGEVEFVGILGTQSQRRTLWRELTQFLEKCDYESCNRFLDVVRAKLGLSDEFTPAYLDDPGASRRFRLLGPGELRTLLSAGMSIGAHTLSHPMLSQLPEDRAWFEIIEGRSRLEKTLGRDVWAFAYPFGGPVSVSDREFRIAEKAGYKAAFLSFGGGFGAPLPRYALPRIHVTGDMTLAEFEAHVSGFYRSLRRQFGREDKSLALPAA